MYGHKGHIYGNYLYVYGGITNEQPQTTLWKYSFRIYFSNKSNQFLESNSWSIVPTTGTTPDALTDFCMGGYENTIYIYGGSKVVEISLTTTSDIFVYVFKE